ncbi:MAG: outer membrane protein transport protein [candidate division Zixibacteria bacterium]|nr:outer membrane protein transport protein [candidate division Zixibacteria bacterium]
MRSDRFFGGMLFFIFLLTESGQTGGYALPGVGAHANGMGGAFRALADDWSAAYWNPAGLAFQTRSEFTLGGILTASRVKYLPRTANGGYNLGFVSDSTEERYPFDRTVPFGTGSLFLRFPQLGRLNVGVAVFTPYHSFSEWDLFSLPYEFTGETESQVPFPFPEKNFNSNIRVVDVHPTAALSLLGGKLALGAGLSVARADWNFSRPVLLPIEESFQSFFDQRDSAQAAQVDSAERVFENNPNLISYPQENVVTMVRLGLGQWGVGGNLGLLFKPTEKLSIGLSYRSPIRFKLKGDYHQQFYFPFNESKLNYFPTSDQTLDGFRFIFSGQGKDLFIGSNATRFTLELPQDFGAGLAFSPSEHWTVAADFSWFNWKVMDSIPVTFEDTSQVSKLGYPTFRFGWKNTIRVSAGARYNFKDRWVFRVGWFFDQSPIPDSSFNPLFLDVGDKHSFNLGVAYLIGRWEMNYNFELLAAQKRDFSQLTGLYVNLPGVYKDTRFTSSASVTYRFDIQSGK